MPFSYNDDDIPQYVPEEDIYIAQPILVDNGNGGNPHCFFGLSSLLAQESESIDCLAVCPPPLNRAESCHCPRITVYNITTFIPDGKHGIIDISFPRLGIYFCGGFSLLYME